VEDDGLEEGQRVLVVLDPLLRHAPEQLRFAAFSACSRRIMTVRERRRRIR
jgi:hypothetical protein